MRNGWRSVCELNAAAVCMCATCKATNNTIVRTYHFLFFLIIVEIRTHQLLIISHLFCLSIFWFFFSYFFVGSYLSLQWRLPRYVLLLFCFCMSSSWCNYFQYIRMVLSLALSMCVYTNIFSLFCSLLGFLILILPFSRIF